MISKRMVKALNEQITAETYSAYLYFSMSSFATSNGMKGMAHWMFVQGQEELTHAFRQFQYVNNQGEQVVMEAIAQPQAKFESPLHMFQEVFLGPVKAEENLKLSDLSAREILTLAPILAVALWIGIYPKPFFMLMAPAVENLVSLLQAAVH